MIYAIPLAWLQLTKQKTRFFVAIAGVAFANVLIFIQLGFQNSLYESTTLIHKSLRADLVLISPKSSSIIYTKPFNRRILYNLLAINEIESVNSLYVNSGDWKNPETYKHRSILVLGINPAEKVFNLVEITQNLNQISLDDGFLFDRASRSEFGPIVINFDKKHLVATELNNKKIKIRGLFTLGASFATDGTLITSDLNFMRLFKERSIEDIDIGLLKVKPTASVEKVYSNLQNNLPKDVELMTIKDFVNFEKNYWANSTAIGFIFGLGVVTGLIVGAVVVYQILYTDILEHLAEYATFKAIGCTDTYLLMVVFQECLIIALVGYSPGLIISWILYILTQKATFLPIYMTGNLAIFVLLLTICMCFISGFIASKKLQEADPADIFNSLY